MSTKVLTQSTDIPTCLDGGHHRRHQGLYVLLRTHNKMLIVSD